MSTRDKRARFNIRASQKKADYQTWWVINHPDPVAAVQHLPFDRRDTAVKWVADEALLNFLPVIGSIIVLAVFILTGAHWVSVLVVGLFGIIYAMHWRKTYLALTELRAVWPKNTNH